MEATTINIDIILIVLLILCILILIVNFITSLRKEKKPLHSEPQKNEKTSLEEGLKKTREGFIDKLRMLFTGATIDAQILNKLEEILITSDVGVKTTMMLLDELKKKLSEEKNSDPKMYQVFLQKKIEEFLSIKADESNTSNQKPEVIMVVGVNGSGKTTSIGKLAHAYRREGKKVLLAAGDTYRAAAIEQLEIWAQKTGADILKKEPGADPSSVLFDAMKDAEEKKYDVLIADTAGRLHTNINLMEQLKKGKRVIQKLNTEAPHKILLVLDATMGQNAINQAREFNTALELTGIILTKLDGTAKGGVIIGIANELKIPITHIGIGEKIDDLKPFDVKEFSHTLFS